MIETTRLELCPLNVNQLKLWCEDIPALEKELNCTYQAEPMQGIFHQIVKEQLTAAENDPDNYVWHSFWFLIRKEDRTVVGSADFKDIPNADREVEIGYGLGKRFEQYFPTMIFTSLGNYCAHRQKFMCAYVCITICLQQLE